MPVLMWSDDFAQIEKTFKKTSSLLQVGRTEWFEMSVPLAEVVLKSIQRSLA